MVNEIVALHSFAYLICVCAQLAKGLHTYKGDFIYILIYYTLYLYIRIVYTIIYIFLVRQRHQQTRVKKERQRRTRAHFPRERAL